MSEVIVMRGDIGLPASSLDAKAVAMLKAELTCQPKGWNDAVPDPVCCLHVENGRLWLPRYFDQSLWKRVADWQWSEGEHQSFTVHRALDPERGQDRAVPAMVSYLQQHNGGVLVAPTGTGKTHMGFTIAAHFERKIGVLVYKGDMFDNWTVEAKKVLGLSPDDIGIVKEDRCDLGKPVTLISIQTLLSRGVPAALGQQVGFLIADELQHYGARRWREVVAMFPARYRLGLSADPTRDDGLDDIITWSFGHIGHKAKRIRTQEVKPPTVVMLYWRRGYPYESYCRWKKKGGQWTQSDPDPMKYDKVLARDKRRTAMYAREIANALEKDRQILVLTRLTAHRDELHKLVSAVTTKTTAVWKAGLKKEQREEVVQADAIFATLKMSSDALNLPKLDTLFIVTPPGDTTQVRGRLREKAEGIERKPLMIVEGFEDTDYAKRRAARRREEYRRAGIEVQEIGRSK